MNSSSRIPAAGPLSYRQAGVDIEAADHFARSLRALAARTHGPDVVPTGDAYGALFRPPLAGLDSPLHKALETLSERLRVVETAAPKALPKSIAGPSVGNTTAPRVSGWGMYDGTPATPESVAALANVIAPKAEQDAPAEPAQARAQSPVPAQSFDEIEELDILDVFAVTPDKQRLACQAKLQAGPGRLRVRAVDDDE